MDFSTMQSLLPWKRPAKGSHPARGLHPAMVRKSSARNSGKGHGKARTKGAHAFFDRMAFGWKTRAALYRHLSTQFANDIAAIPADRKSVV